MSLFFFLKPGKSSATVRVDAVDPKILFHAKPRIYTLPGANRSFVLEAKLATLIFSSKMRIYKFKSKFAFGDAFLFPSKKRAYLWNATNRIYSFASKGC